MAKRRGSKWQDETAFGGKLESLACALAAGMTRAEAARHAKVSQRTVYRRLQEAAFRARVKAARDQLNSAMVGRLAGLGRTVADGLGELIKDPDKKIRLGAMRLVVAANVRMGAGVDLAERMAAIEEAMAAAKGDPQP